MRKMLTLLLTASSERASPSSGLGTRQETVEGHGAGRLGRFVAATPSLQERDGVTGDISRGDELEPYAGLAGRLNKVGVCCKDKAQHRRVDKIVPATLRPLVFLRQRGIP